MSLSWSDEAPAVGEYIELRRITGMERRAPSAAAEGLRNSLHVVTVRERARLVGMGRLVGDRGCFAQVVDIAVDPEFRGQGLGTEILQRLIDWSKAELPASCHVNLIAEPGAFALYKKLGFEIRTGMELSVS
ncbi:acetyltransferase [Roseivivax marinus]|uniref:Acetyltransferase n=1 Tax=Roseivivax marinus TaxID=1379903 RepID=W4HG94_9RHOB|nr:GNAT family N-acetyltransferase [Roseivivax marinus]ETW11171.1 acetyltransferase [Roseivivax marinus]UMA65461.1 GNAT family N-acetyltransferase [Roseivivax marinus]SEL78265.1 Acetyltransferase (GNAT) domain-containing protein [Roseivivax marinus]